MEDNKNPKGAARSAAPLGWGRRRRLVVFLLGRISYVFASLPVLAPRIIFFTRLAENFLRSRIGAMGIEMHDPNPKKQ